MQQNDLQHYGVKGMKWGVIRSKSGRADARQSRKLKRHVAATKKNLKEKGRIHESDANEYDEASRNYQKTMSRPSLNKEAKLQRIKEASQTLTAAGAKIVKSKSDLNRAKRLYQDDAAAFEKHTKEMLEKYGSENVRKLSTMKIHIGSRYTEEVLKTGLTLSEIPIIGTMYNGHYIAGRELADRMTRIEAEADKRY